MSLIYFRRNFLIGSVLICLSWLLVFPGHVEAQPNFSRSNTSRGSSSQPQEEFRDSGITADTAKIFYLHPDDLRFVRVKRLTLQEFQQFNPAIQRDFNYLYLSNNGSPARALIYEPLIRTGFDAGYHQYDLYLQTIEQARYYNAYRPYTDLYFSANTQENNRISATFAQNVSESVNFAIDYQKFTERGFYQSQRVRHTNLGITSWFRTNGDRYLGFFAWKSNNLKNQNNGGVTADSLLLLGQFRNNLALVPINTANAQTEYDQSEFSYTQFLNFGPRAEKKPRPERPEIDTTFQYFESDTTSNFSGPPTYSVRPDASGPPVPASRTPIPYVERDMPAIRPQTGLKHRITYRNQQYKFFDDNPEADSAFYGNYQTSQAGIRHFVRIRTLENYFSTQFSFGKKDKNSGQSSLLLEPFIRHSLFFVDREPETFQVNNLFVGGDLSIRTGNEFLDLTLHAQTGLVDNAGDILVKGNLGLEIPKIGRLETSLLSQIYSPNLIQQKLYISQELIWENDFQKTNELSLQAGLRIDKFNAEVGASYHLIDKLIYFDQTSFPAQAQEPVSVFQLKWKQSARFWLMGFEGIAAFQIVDKDFLRLPEFWTRAGIYFTGKIFGTMETRLGGDLTFTSAYRGDRYLSASGQFYLQDQVSLTALPMFEVYFSARVRNFRAMIKAVNLSDLMFTEALFAAPNYPYPGYHIRFAIGWRFID